MNDINIFLVRHGESTANVLTDQIGQDNDTPLTEKGVSQANLLGHRFRIQGIVFDEMWSSTYLRTQGQLAEIVRKIVGYEAELKLTDADIQGNMIQGFSRVSVVPKYMPI